MKIIMYTKPGCPWCAGAKEFLTSKGIAFEERDVRSNEAFMKELIEKSGQSKTPTLDIDGQILADTDADAIAKYLKI